VTSRAQDNEVVAIASRDGERAATAARAIGIPHSYGRYAALLADPEVDAVYIPLPNHLHAPMSIAAMEAGKHVLCEKPIALNHAEATSIETAIARTGRRTMEALMYRHHPQWDAVRSTITEGLIGDVRITQAVFSYEQTDDQNIRWRPDGGGALYDIGCYTIHSARMMFGSKPDYVEATARHHRGVDVVTSAVLSFPTGHATFTVSVEQAGSQGMHIVGMKGSISIERPYNPWIGQNATITIETATGVDAQTIPETDQFQIEIERFSSAILSGSEFEVPMHDSLSNMDVIDRVFAAANG
jgi:predicted dehydrogenase